MKSHAWQYGNSVRSSGRFRMEIMGHLMCFECKTDTKVILDTEEGDMIMIQKKMVEVRAFLENQKNDYLEDCDETRALRAIKEIHNA